MTEEPARTGAALSARAKLTIIVGFIILAVVFVAHIGQIVQPFLWALLAAYLLAPVVNYLNVEGKLPRLWAVTLIYALIGILLLAASRYLYPRIVEQGTVFIEDIPRLENALIATVGPRPLGIDINSLVNQTVATITGLGRSQTAGHLLVNALETFIKVFLFLVATFYLLMDAPRLGSTARASVPPEYRDELAALARQIHLTWQQYIRGELVLFLIMATATTIGLTALGVPGALFIGLATGALELLPLVGPYTAGALAVTVAWFNGANPFGWSQFAYAGAVALMYFVFRELEDYIVIPHVLGRAVRLHPLVVLFAVTAGGIVGGLLGLVLAVPIAASVKAVLVYVYSKLLDRPVEFQPVRTLGGGVIEIPVYGADEPPEQDPEPAGAGPAQPADAR